METWKLAISGFFICSIIFTADILLGYSIVPIGYVIFLLLAILLKETAERMSAIFLIGTLLTALGLFYGGFGTNTDELTIRFLAWVIFASTSAIAVVLKQKEEELLKINESLELKILARTAAAENRARQLQEQIRYLQDMRHENTNKSILRMDEIISNLKRLAAMEISDATK